MHAFPLRIKRSSCERATYLLRYFRSHGVGVTMYGESKLLRTLGDLFLKTGLKNAAPLRTRRSATLKDFDAVALQWLSCDSRYAVCMHADLQLCVGSFNGSDQ